MRHSSQIHPEFCWALSFVTRHMDLSQRTHCALAWEAICAAGYGCLLPFSEHSQVWPALWRAASIVPTSGVMTGKQRAGGHTIRFQHTVHLYANKKWCAHRANETGYDCPLCVLRAFWLGNGGHQTWRGQQVSHLCASLLQFRSWMKNCSTSLWRNLMDDDISSFLHFFN